jgi:hypothetical protein
MRAHVGVVGKNDVCMCRTCSWAAKRELVDCSGTSLPRQHSVEFQGTFYFLAGPDEEAAFCADPLRFLVNQQVPATNPAANPPPSH